MTEEVQKEKPKYAKNSLTSVCNELRSYLTIPNSLISFKLVPRDFFISFFTVLEIIDTSTGVCVLRLYELHGFVTSLRIHVLLITISFHIITS